MSGKLLPIDRLRCYVGKRIRWLHNGTEWFGGLCIGVDADEPANIMLVRLLCVSTGEPLTEISKIRVAPPGGMISVPIAVLQLHAQERADEWNFDQSIAYVKGLGDALFDHVCEHAEDDTIAISREWLGATARNLRSAARLLHERRFH